MGERVFQQNCREYSMFGKHPKRICRITMAYQSWDVAIFFFLSFPPPLFSLGDPASNKVSVLGWKKSHSTYCIYGGAALAPWDKNASQPPFHRHNMGKVFFNSKLYRAYKTILDNTAQDSTIGLVGSNLLKLLKTKIKKPSVVIK